MMKLTNKITDLFSDRIWTLDTGSATSAYAELVRIVKLIRITFKTFTENRMGFQCVALSYFITLALVPLIAFAFAITGGLGLDGKITEFLQMALPNNPEIVSLLSERAAGWGEPSGRAAFLSSHLLLPRLHQLLRLRRPRPGDERRLFLLLRRLRLRPDRQPALLLRLLRRPALRRQLRQPVHFHIQRLRVRRRRARIRP